MFLIKVISQDPKNPFSDVIINFKEDEKQWFLRGNYSGYCKNAKGYVSMPVNGQLQKLFHEDEVGDIFTKKFVKINKKQIRLIWNYLISNNFHRDKDPDILKNYKDYLV